MHLLLKQIGLEFLIISDRSELQVATKLASILADAVQVNGPHQSLIPSLD